LSCVQIIPFAPAGGSAHFSQMEQPSRPRQEKPPAAARSPALASLTGALRAGDRRGVESVKNYGSISCHSFLPLPPPPVAEQAQQLAQNAEEGGDQIEGVEHGASPMMGLGHIIKAGRRWLYDSVRGITIPETDFRGVPSDQQHNSVKVVGTAFQADPVRSQRRFANQKRVVFNVEIERKRIRDLRGVAHGLP